MDIKQIIRSAGGPLAVSRAVGRHHSAVCKWWRVPAPLVLTVAGMSGIPAHAIRPDVFPAHAGSADDTTRAAENAIHDGVTTP